jgi:hypothetical protein
MHIRQNGRLSFGVNIFFHPFSKLSQASLRSCGKAQAFLYFPIAGVLFASGFVAFGSSFPAG